MFLDPQYIWVDLSLFARSFSNNGHPNRLPSKILTDILDALKELGGVPDSRLTVKSRETLGATKESTRVPDSLFDDRSKFLNQGYSCIKIGISPKYKVIISILKLKLHNAIYIPDIRFLAKLKSVKPLIIDISGNVPINPLPAK